jgi:hypothetical protein
MEVFMYLKYLWYVIKHKWFVMIECFKVGIYWRGLTHDLSKLLPSEFFPYANYFYGNGKNDKEFNKAWLLHQKRNPHHWQYWLLYEDEGRLTTLDIPIKYRKEMIADWIGAGRAITGKDNTKKWYELNKNNMLLNRETRNWIEERI